MMGMPDAKDRPSSADRNSGEPDRPDALEEGPDAMRDLGEALADKDWSAAFAALQRASSLCDTDYAEGGPEEER